MCCHQPDLRISCLPVKFIWQCRHEAHILQRNESAIASIALQTQVTKSEGCSQPIVLLHFQWRLASLAFSWPRSCCPVMSIAWYLWPASRRNFCAFQLSVSSSTLQWLRWAQNTLLSNYPIWTHRRWRQTDGRLSPIFEGRVYLILQWVFYWNNRALTRGLDI